MRVHHERISHYVLTGALSGAASTAVGAAMLHGADPDRFGIRHAAEAGFVGGAITHAGIGLLAAFAPDESLKRQLYHLGSSAVLSSLTSAALGGAVLGLAGHTAGATSDLILEGALGGIAIGVAGGIVALGLGLCGIGLWCCKEVQEEAYQVLEHGEEHA